MSSPPRAHNMLCDLHTIIFYSSSTYLHSFYVFKDALDKEFSSLPLHKRIKTILGRNLLSSAIDTLTTWEKNEMSIEISEAVAKIRYSLLVVTELLHHEINEQVEASKDDTDNLYTHTLIDEAR